LYAHMSNKTIKKKKESKLKQKRFFKTQEKKEN
jgi:hypothetical protein